MRLASSRVFRLILVAVASLLSGCGKSDRPPLGMVAGVVIFDGQPLPEALVLFTPEGPGRTSRAITDAEGNYELAYLRDIMGADIGRHAVRITTVTDDNGGKERLPRRYHSATTLEATVDPGSNRIDFALKSK
jgi:hypothetical protein